MLMRLYFVYEIKNANKFGSTENACEVRGIRFIIFADVLSALTVMFYH